MGEIILSREYNKNYSFSIFVGFWSLYEMMVINRSNMTEKSFGEVKRTTNNLLKDKKYEWLIVQKGSIIVALMHRTLS